MLNNIGILIITLFVLAIGFFIYYINVYNYCKKEKKEFKFIKNIIELLKSQSLPGKIGTQKEIKIFDIFEKDFYSKLYQNLIYYKSKNYKIIKKEQQYIFNNTIEIMSLIYYYQPDLFLTSNFLRCISLLIVEMTKSQINLNNEFVAKLFYGLLNCVQKIKDPIINKEIKNFENDMFLIMKTCLNKFYCDFDTYLDSIKPLLKPSNVEEIIEHLNSIISDLNLESIFPFYLKGLIEYFGKTQIEKYIIIKIYNYFKIFITTKYENKSDDYYYLGYTLYSIINSVERKIKLNLKDFYNLKKNRLNNKYAKKILILAIDLLKSKNYQEFNEICKKKNINFNSNYPKISNNFDNNDKYYEDLYNQLVYSISDCIKKSFNCIIPFQQETERALWLSYIEILLICLREDNINDNKIKVIFYFIVNIFSTQLESNSLEFCKDTIPLLFLESIHKSYIFEFPEIYKLFDSEYSEYYSHIDDNSKFYFGLSNYLYDFISSNSIYKKYIQQNISINCEINNLKKFNNNLPFPIICDYLQGIDIPFSIKDKIYFPNSGIKILYKNSYNYINELENKKILFEKYPSNINNTNNNDVLLDSVIKDENFIILLKDIMKSKVMREAYTLINKWYMNKGKFDLKNESEKIEEINEDSNCQNQKNKDYTIKKEFISNDNNNALINKLPIIDYYNKFCNTLTNLDYSKIFIIMNLPSVIKGFTFRFLKIILNSNGIEFKLTNKKKENCDNINMLIKAYLVFVIIHEQNHFMKRYENQGVNFNLCKTPIINNVKEGGEQLIDLLFGDILINNCINKKQAKYILDINNWNKKTLCQFRNDFIKINKEGNESSIESSIIYLKSYPHSICDHSKLSI